MTDPVHDVIIIGAGPGGYVAAIRASQLGLRVAIVEREHLGGVCLNWGCIPAKTLLRGAEVLNLFRDAARYGVIAPDVHADITAMVARSRQVAEKLTGGVESLLRRYGVDIINGAARIDSPGRVAVRSPGGQDEEVTYRARDIVLATGARARELPAAQSDGKLIWTYRHALTPEDIPERLLIVGAGAIGMEFASFFNALGSAVTVLEARERVLPDEDEEVSRALQDSMQAQGVRFLTSSKFGAVSKHQSTLSCRVVHEGAEEPVAVDRMIVAAGIVGNIEDLGLEALGIATERGHVLVDPHCATGVPGIWAIGDVAGPPWLAHKASHEGLMVAELIAGNTAHHTRAIDIPRCTYSHPQVASIGLTEEEARADGYPVRIGRFPLRANGRALTHGDTEGFVKTVFDASTGEILGAHLIGADVTELIHGFGIARTLESTELELMSTVFPHPTISEAIHESVLSAHGRSIHI